jgi:flavin-dependent dehydrogenase
MKSVIECLQDDVKHYDEELYREFAKQVKDPRKQTELMNKRRKCVDEIRNEWDKQHKDDLKKQVADLTELAQQLLKK